MAFDAPPEALLGTHCIKCQKAIPEDQIENWKLDGKPACEECYFEGFDDEVRAHPIFSLVTRRSRPPVSP